MGNFNSYTPPRDTAPLEHGAELDFQKSNLPSMKEIRRGQAEVARNFKVEKSKEKMTVFTEARALGARVSWARGRKAYESRPLDPQADLGTAQ